MTTDLVAIRSEREYLATVEEIRALAERIPTLDGARELAARATAAQVYAQRAKLGREKEMLAMAARRWAERRAGELLIRMREDGERVAGGPGFAAESPGATLRDLGVTKHESSRWQKLAQIPADRFADLASAVDRDLTRAARTDREAKLRDERVAQETEAKTLLNGLGADACRLLVADVHTWRPDDVDAIITDPPYVGDSIPLYVALRDFAVDVLPAGGALVVMTWQAILPEVLAALAHPRLAYRWMLCWRYGNSEDGVDYPRRVFVRWKPILVYHAEEMPTKATVVRDEIVNAQADKDHHEWGQALDGFRRLVESFSLPGQLVCDPFLGAGTTGLAALGSTRRFVGADIDAAAVATTKQRMA